MHREIAPICAGEGANLSHVIMMNASRRVKEQVKDVFRVPSKKDFIPNTISCYL